MITVMDATAAIRPLSRREQCPIGASHRLRFPPPPADGKIAYASNQDFLIGNRDEIYTMYANGFRKTRITNNARGDTDPDWERAGGMTGSPSRAVPTERTPRSTP